MKEGDTVRVDKEVLETLVELGEIDLTTPHETAKIQLVLTETAFEGSVCLDRPLYGCRYWDKYDLELVEDENV